MSDTMDHAVIKAPFDFAMSDDISRYQFYTRAQAILDERNALRTEIEHLREITQASCGIGDGEGDKKLLVHGDPDSVLRVRKIVCDNERKTQQLQALRKEVLNLCDVVENMDEHSPLKFALHVGKAINEVRRVIANSTEEESKDKP